MCEICGSNGASIQSITITSIAGPTTVYVCTEFYAKLNEAKKARAVSMLRDLAATKDIPQWPEEAKAVEKPVEVKPVEVKPVPSSKEWPEVKPVEKPVEKGSLWKKGKR